MQRMKPWKVCSCSMAMALVLCISPVSGADNVANTSQKGSLLFFPLIDVRQCRQTVIRMTNDANQGVNVKCYYVNQSKGRADFQFYLTKKQPMVWDAASGTGEPLHVTPFPAGEQAIAFGDPFQGELICFAVNPQGSHQISWNHLSGTVTVLDVCRGTGFLYASTNSKAKGGTAGNKHGSEKGKLNLNGQDGDYDACPAYNIVHFAPPGTVSGAITYTDTEIAVSTCAQDLRQDFTPHWTKIQLPVWNAHEVKFTGAYECVDSTHSFLLTGLDAQPGNTSSAVLRTTAAHLQLQGVASTQCGPFLPPGAVTEHTGLLAVAVSFMELAVSTGTTVTVTPVAGATTANHAGVAAVPGFVLWDPQDDVVPELR